MVFGFDVSTSVIGFAEFTNDGKFVRSEHIDLSKIEGMIPKMWEAHRWLGLTLPKIGEEKYYAFIEDRLGNFSAGRSMLQTLMKLAAFNFAFSWAVELELAGRCAISELHHIHPSTVKAIVKREGLIIPKGSKEKKKLTLDFVAKREPTFLIEHTRTGTPKPYMFDRSDAYVTALAGIRRFVCSPTES